MDDEVCVRATLKAHKKRHKSMLWLLDNNCEGMIEPQEGDVWEIQLIKKISREDLFKRHDASKKSG